MKIQTPPHRARLACLVQNRPKIDVQRLKIQIREDHFTDQIYGVLLGVVRIRDHQLLSRNVARFVDAVIRIKRDSETGLSPRFQLARLLIDFEGLLALQIEPVSEVGSLKNWHRNLRRIWYVN
jgi:hypothetical protein